MFGNCSSPRETEGFEGLCEMLAFNDSKLAFNDSDSSAWRRDCQEKVAAGIAFLQSLR